MERLSFGIAKNLDALGADQRADGYAQAYARIAINVGYWRKADIGRTGDE